MNLTPRIFGLAENGFDPATIAHMLGITFAQVDEGLRGLEVPDTSGGAALLGVRLAVATNALGPNVEDFFADPPPGYAGKPTEPKFDAVTPPYVVGPGEVFEINVQAAPAMLSPFNVNFYVTNMDGTQTLLAYSPESLVPADLGGDTYTLHSKDFYLPGVLRTGEDLHLRAEGDAEEKAAGEESGEAVISTAGGIFVVRVGVSMEPQR